MSLRYIKAKSRFNIELWTSQGRKRARGGKIFKCSLSLSGWITWGVEFSRNSRNSFPLCFWETMFFLFWSVKSTSCISGSNQGSSTGKQLISYRRKLPWEDCHQNFSVSEVPACCFPGAIFWCNFSQSQSGLKSQLSHYLAI